MTDRSICERLSGEALLFTWKTLMRHRPYLAHLGYPTDRASFDAENSLLLLEGTFPDLSWRRDIEGGETIEDYLEGLGRFTRKLKRHGALTSKHPPDPMSAAAYLLSVSDGWVVTPTDQQVARGFFCLGLRTNFFPLTRDHLRGTRYLLAALVRKDEVICSLVRCPFFFMAMALPLIVNSKLGQIAVLPPAGRSPKPLRLPVSSRVAINIGQRKMIFEILFGHHRLLRREVIIDPEAKIDLMILKQDLGPDHGIGGTVGLWFDATEVFMHVQGLFDRVIWKISSDTGLVEMITDTRAVARISEELLGQ